MEKSIRKTYEINAPIGQVWQALINPVMIKQYFFGTDAVSDWKVGSTIQYTGEWQGQRYRDKGVIQSMIPEKELSISYWSDRSGKPDSPENYSTHSYELTELGENTTSVTIFQEDTYLSEESRDKAWQHWDVVMEGLEKVVSIEI